MRTRWSRALLAAAIALSGPAIPQARADADADAFLRGVDRAIERGVERIRALWHAARAPDGRLAFRISSSTDARVAFGEDMLASLAALHGLDGRPFDELGAVLESARARWRTADSTYGVSLALMLFAEARRQADESRSATRGTPGRPLRALPAWLDAEALEMAKAISLWRERGGGWPYSAILRTWDISNTQFAMRALWEARRFGFRTKSRDMAEVLRATLALRSQEGEEVVIRLAQRPVRSGRAYADPDAFSVVSARDRGFRYAPLAATSASTTSSGLVVLAALRAMALADPRSERANLPDIDAALGGGIVWLGKRHAPGRNLSLTLGDDQLRRFGGAAGIKAGDTSTVDDKTWSSLVLWNLAQLMDMLGTDGPGDSPWYRAGAEHLVGTQKKDGRWQLSGQAAQAGPAADPSPLGTGVMRYMDLCDTAFATIFLRRARERFTEPDGVFPGSQTGDGPSAPIR